MLYHTLFQIAFNQYGNSIDSFLVKGLNVFPYVMFRTALAAITAFVISIAIGDKLIKKLVQMNVGQKIREDGPQSHKHKEDTPTMGGILIIGVVIISALLCARLDNFYLWLALLSTVLFGSVGFADDYMKILKKRNLGLTEKQKIFGQIVVAVLVWGCLWLWTDYPWNISVPFFKATADTNPLTSISWAGPVIYLGMVVLTLVGTSNAVNFTDGLDGLAISITFIAMLPMTILTYVTSDGRWAEYLDLTFRPEAAELTVFCGALGGASLGFLWFNAPKAEVFMGDVGSLSIGGALGTVAILTKQELMLIFIGGVFVIEALSVLLQRYCFKLTKDRQTGIGKRVFLMAPLHHHFEKKWGDGHEAKIVTRFIILAVFFALISLTILNLR